jgi:hypothetical protein
MLYSVAMIVNLPGLGPYYRLQQSTYEKLSASTELGLGSEQLDTHIAASPAVGHFSSKFGDC